MATMPRFSAFVIASVGVISPVVATLIAAL